MLEEFLERFKALAPIYLPELINLDRIEETEYTDDYALITFHLPYPIPIDEVLDMFEDNMELEILYHVLPSTQTRYGESACAYTNGQYGHMYKFNTWCDDQGHCTVVYATVFASLEFMDNELKDELDRVTRHSTPIHVKDRGELLASFF